MHWTNDKVELENPQRPYADCRQRKIRDLESEGDLFGSKVGRWTRAWKQGGVKLKSDVSLMNLLQMNRSSKQGVLKVSPLK
jgi:hypothetical protein